MGGTLRKRPEREDRAEGREDGGPGGGRSNSAGFNSARLVQKSVNNHGEGVGPTWELYVPRSNLELCMWFIHKHKVNQSCIQNRLGHVLRTPS